MFLHVLTFTMLFSIKLFVYQYPVYRNDFAIYMYQQLLQVYPLMWFKVVICGKYKNLNKITKI